MGVRGGGAALNVNQTKWREVFSQRRNLQKQPALSLHNGSVPAGFVDSSASAG